MKIWGTVCIAGQHFYLDEQQSFFTAVAFFFPEIVYVDRCGIVHLDWEDHIQYPSFWDESSYSPEWLQQSGDDVQQISFQV